MRNSQNTSKTNISQIQIPDSHAGTDSAYVNEHAGKRVNNPPITPRRSNEGDQSSAPSQWRRNQIQIQIIPHSEENEERVCKISARIQIPVQN